MQDSSNISDVHHEETDGHQNVPNLFRPSSSPSLSPTPFPSPLLSPLNGYAEPDPSFPFSISPMNKEMPDEEFSGHRKRFKFSREQIDKLEEQYAKECYLSKKDRGLMAEQLKVPENSIRVWFQNRRTKDSRRRQSFVTKILQAAADYLAMPYVYKSISTPCMTTSSLQFNYGYSHMQYQLFPPPAAPLPIRPRILDECLPSFSREIGRRSDTLMDNWQSRPSLTVGEQFHTSLYGQQQLLPPPMGYQTHTLPYAWLPYFSPMMAYQSRSSPYDWGSQSSPMMEYQFRSSPNDRYTPVSPPPMNDQTYTSAQDENSPSIMEDQSDSASHERRSPPSTQSTSSLSPTVSQ